VSAKESDENPAKERPTKPLAAPTAGDPEPMPPQSEEPLIAGASSKLEADKPTVNASRLGAVASEPTLLLLTRPTFKEGASSKAAEIPVTDGAAAGSTGEKCSADAPIKVNR